MVHHSTNVKCTITLLSALWVHWGENCDREHWRRLRSNFGLTLSRWTGSSSREEMCWLWITAFIWAVCYYRPGFITVISLYPCNLCLLPPRLWELVFHILSHWFLLRFLLSLSSWRGHNWGLLIWLHWDYEVLNCPTTGWKSFIYGLLINRG